ncbi:G-type lectin S-receptor-like serine/threonine-protein kinase At4g27290 isoform X2 [Cicer arietinum]|uniref:Receptor-like serine/threonine-protein kinase n=1 Tax=Cicer arietinum TaxID=3827 RepID=A0A3Q7XQV7_CICAR|nr:G-type lectin S-receptor-like serine/threonine-protein kinase At4g27290 isoform X2 [Cicer arietinum]
MTILPSILLITKLLLLFSIISSATDTITHSQSLLDGSTLVSNDGTFELGFFNPGNSPNRYVGIWYKQIPIRRVVWVANRDNPTKDNSSKLIITQDGNLKLLNQNQSLLWSTNTTTTTTKVSIPIVQLLDNGNLVLKNEKDNNTEENFLWQSFDHPCDTVLPGMKAGRNKKKGLDSSLLNSWKNWDDPSSSDFTSTMVLTPNPESLIKRGSTILYRTGPWTGPQSGGVIGLTENSLYDYEFVNNEDEVYYIFKLKNSSVVSIIVLNQTLSVRQRLIWISESMTWSVYQKLPQDSCDVYNVCGANARCVIDASPMCQCLEGFKPKLETKWNAMDWSDGCVRSGNWSCGVKDRDGFGRIVGMKLPDTTHSWIDYKMSLKECKAKCLKNCSCTAYSNLDSTGEGSGCSIWFGNLIDLRVLSSGQDLYVRIDASIIAKIAGDKNGHTKTIVLGVSITVSIVLVMLLGFTYIYITKAKCKDKTITLGEKVEDKNEDYELPIFDQATILKATNNFSIDNKLGEGGFGPVYKGTLFNGQEIAVKRLSKSSGQGLKEFKNEVILCAKLQHRNLVKVVGCCIEGEEKMLIYEYMPNKSLDLFIFDPFQSKLLDWSARFNILFGIARGLLYLHQDSRFRIIHRDLKVNNILLDNDMNPKISDFGLARMCGGDQIEGRTNRIVGTYGYMAPEYAIDGLFSIKSDVFSFGVLLLEIISGKKNRALTYHEHDHNLIGHAWRLWKESIPFELIDDNLRNSCIISEVSRCIQIGLLCLQHHPNDRPNMASVVVMLSSENALPKPKEPGFLIKKFSIEGEPSSERQTSSTNEITISLLDAR